MARYGLRVRFLLLGPVGVLDASGTPLTLGGPRIRAVLASLLLSVDGMVGVDRLLADVWGEDLPREPRRALQIAVSRLRSALGACHRISWEGGGYRLDVADREIDLRRFVRLAEEGRQRLASGDPDGASARLSEALGLWRGPALGGLGDLPLVRTEGERLEELRLAATEDQLQAELAAGRHAAVVADLRQLVARHPLRERLRGQLMLALYRTGRQGAALAEFRAARQELLEEIGSDPGPDLRALHAAVLAQDPELHAPTQGEEAPTNLVEPLTSFVGRDADVGSVAALLEENRLVTVTGTGGSGKTRIAVEVALRVRGRHPGGAWFVDLAPLERDGGVAVAVARALGLRTSGDDRSLDLLARRVGDGAMLLVLDNCEHVLGGVAPLVHRLLSTCRNLRVLATSRQPLGVPGEQRWSLRGLAVPPPRRSTSRPDGLQDVAAVRLFVERARAAVPGFAPEGEELDAVARICRQLAGLPLAIELAAPWVRLLSCEQIAQRLHPSDPVLAATTTSAAQRHRTLRSTLDWSYDRLDDDEKALLHRLSIFRGPVPLSAVESVAVGSGWGGDDVLAVLGRLVACSLVEVEPQREEETTFRLLEPVREHTAERREHDGSATAICDAHTGWCLELWSQANEQLRREQAGGAALAHRLDTAHEDLRSAIERCLASGQETLALRLVGAAYVYWWTYGHMVEGITWVRRTVEAAETTPSAARVTALAGLAVMEAHVGLIDADRATSARAAATASAAVADAEELSRPRRPREYADALVVKGHTQLDSDGGPHEAERLVRAGLAIADEHGDRWAAGYARMTLAAAAWHRGDLEAAVAAYQDVLADMERSGATAGLIAAHYNLGDLALQLGRYTQARAHLEAVLSVKDRTGTDPFGRSHSRIEELALLARACSGAGDEEAAARYARQATAAAEELGDPHALQRCRELLAPVTSRHQAP